MVLQLGDQLARRDPVPVGGWDGVGAPPGTTQAREGQET